MSKSTSINPFSVKGTSQSAPQSSNSSINSTRSSTVSRVKEHLHHIRKTWGPLMAAKEHLDDQYNFPPGRYAGQGFQKGLSERHD